MKKVFSFLSILLTAIGTTMSAADSTFIDYQNYNHGYCPECSCYPCRCDLPYYAEPVPPPGAIPPPPPCDPCPIPDPCAPCDPYAPVCGTQCGLTICAIGVAIAAVAATAAIVISTGEGSSDHAHNP